MVWLISRPLRFWPCVFAVVACGSGHPAPTSTGQGGLGTAGAGATAIADAGQSVCTAPLDCSVQPCRPFSAFAAFDAQAFCSGGGQWFATGHCGELAFEGESNGFGGPTYFWNTTTGDLVAIYATADYGAFCDGKSSSIVYGDLSTVAACAANVSKAGMQCSASAGR